MELFVKPVRPIERVFIHCSASNNKKHDDVSVMASWHKERWPVECAEYPGYHYFIQTDGDLQAGRPLEMKPVAQAGHNSHTIAICLHGLNEADFTKAQFNTLKELCKRIDTAYIGAVTFHGHREVAAKSCPVFDYRTVLGLDSYGRLRGAMKSPFPTTYPTLKEGNRGGAVAQLQQALGITADGDFGSATKKAVMAFQHTHGLQADGIVGKKTWDKLLTK